MRFIQGFSTKIKAELRFRKALKEEKQRVYQFGNHHEVLPDYIPFYNFEIKIFNDRMKDLKFKSIRVYAEWHKRMFFLGEKTMIKADGRSVRDVSLSVSNHPLFTIFLYYDWEKYKQEKAIGRHNYYFQRFPHDVVLCIIFEQHNGKKTTERIKLYK